MARALPSRSFRPLLLAGGETQRYPVTVAVKSVEGDTVNLTFEVGTEPLPQRVELRQAILRRRMVRSFEDRPVDPEAVDRLLEHALHAPSAGFSQGWAFLVLTEAADRRRFWDAVFPDRSDDFAHPGLFNAGCIIVPLSHKQAYLDRYAEPDKGWADRDEGRWPVPYWDIDTGMASMLILLTAVDEGLGALFFGIFGEHVDAFRTAFGVPAELRPIGAIAVGHRAPDVPSPSLRRGRRGLDEVVHRGRW